MVLINYASSLCVVCDCSFYLSVVDSVRSLVGTVWPVLNLFSQPSRLDHQTNKQKERARTLTNQANKTTQKTRGEREWDIQKLVYGVGYVGDRRTNNDSTAGISWIQSNNLFILFARAYLIRIEPHSFICFNIYSRGSGGKVVSLSTCD